MWLPFFLSPPFLFREVIGVTMPLEGGGKALFGLREELPAVMPGGDSPTSMDIGGKIRNAPCKNLCTVSVERSGFFEQCLGNQKWGKGSVCVLHSPSAGGGAEKGNKRRRRKVGLIKWREVRPKRRRGEEGASPKFGRRGSSEEEGEGRKGMIAKPSLSPLL